VSISGRALPSFLAPGRVVHGPGAAAGLGSILHEAGRPTGAVLLVSDRGVASAGLLAGPERSLAAAGYKVTVFADLASEPDLPVTGHTLDLVRDVQPVAVIGVGGGSAMDLAKVAALGATNPGGIGDLILAGARLSLPLPQFQLPTTAGTGSEATRVAVLNGAERKLILAHPGLVSTAAVLDPELTMGLPAATTASTGLDAICHAVESFLSLDATPLTADQSLAALRRLTAILPTSVANGKDLRAREEALIGAYQAGLALNAGVVVGHSIAYTISKRTGLAHGVATAMALPYCLAFNLPRTPERQELLSNTFRAAGRAVNGSLAQAVSDLVRELDSSTGLQQVGIHESAIEVMADECIEVYPRPNNPEPLTKAGLMTLLKFMLVGDLAGFERVHV
jgi:alcohol dehydrogenase class IV